MRRGNTRFYYRQAFEYSKASSSFFNAALAGNHALLVLLCRFTRVQHAGQPRKREL